MTGNLRVQLAKEKQKVLIEKAKATKNLSWSDLAYLLNLNPHYLSHELRSGKCTLSLSVFKQLCAISGEEFSNDAQAISSNWGQKKGGAKSGNGKPKRVQITVGKSTELAELIGIILGDGHLDINYKSGNYAVKICGGYGDLEYLEYFVAPLFLKVFGKQLKKFNFKTANAVMFYLNDKTTVFSLEYYGLKAGNKKKNNVRIPDWVFENEEYLKSCIRGLFDTDGAVFPKSSINKVPQLELTSNIDGIQRTYRKGLLQLGLKPSKWFGVNSPKCGLYAKNQVMQFSSKIGFHNPKHSKRFNVIAGKK